jgi:hypothetical protein
VVVFSQWTRTHHIVIRRLEQRGIGYVSFNGEVPSDRRPALVQRFRDDPDCRVFLSTDAGATGLNLQHASILVNMDLPWNPAILEQRIARIHRMGQVRPVQVVSFVAKGTIEEGMLSVLRFKRSLSAGILDGGLGDVALGGSRLTRFMKEIEGVTGRVNESEAMAPSEEAEAVGGAAGAQPGEGDMAGGEAPDAPREGGADGNVDPWATLLQMGSQFLSALAMPDPAHDASHPWIERDPRTGARNLRIPLPPPATAQRLADALTGLAGLLRGASSGARAPER